MEHIIFKHIMEHLETHNILADFQHGFREKRSCQTQLIITVEEISRYLDNKQQVDMHDFSKIYLGMVQFHLLLPGVFYTRLYLDHLALLIFSLYSN
jgi:hypothetical protein